MKYVCIFLITVYQKVFSRLKPTPTCRFYPCCSSYALEAYKVHGFFKGSFLTVKRVLKCNPFCKGGIDYVPPKITLKAKEKQQKF